MKKHEEEYIEEDDIRYTEEELAESEAEGRKNRKNRKKKAKKEDEAVEGIELAEVVVEPTEEVDEVEETSQEVEEPADETEVEPYEDTEEPADEAVVEPYEDTEDSVEEADEAPTEEYEESTDEYEDDEEEYLDEETIRRNERKRRRVRNQIISYVVTLVVVAVLGTGLYFFSSWILDYIHQYMAEQYGTTTEVTEAEVSNEEVAVAAPDSVEVAAPEETSEPGEEVDETIYEEVDYLGEAVDATISQMTIEDKVAQLFMITPEMLTGVNAVTQAGNGTKDALTQYAVGGLVYNSKNIVDAEQVKTMLENTGSMSKYELFFAVNEPGGEGNVIGNSPIKEIPPNDSPSEISESGDSNNAYHAGLTIGSYLSNLGFNLNIAPDGSILTSEDSVAATTSYGSDEAVVYDMVVKMIQGLKESNVQACMTGFPGNGAILEKTADSTVETDISATDLEAQLLPYISGTASGAEMVMLNNVTYTVADPEACPASVSKYIIGSLLRENMGYEGVVITAPLSDKAITEKYTSAEAAVNALLAGADMLYLPENFEEAYNGVLEAVSSGVISEDRINESLQRIFRVKLADNIE